MNSQTPDRPRGWSAGRAAPGHAVQECLRDACTPRHRPDRVAERRSLVCDSLFGDVLQPIWCRSGASTGNCTFASALLGCTYELLRERCMFRKLSNVFMRVVLTVSSYLVDTWTRFFPSPGLAEKVCGENSSDLYWAAPAHYDCASFVGGPSSVGVYSSPSMAISRNTESSIFIILLQKNQWLYIFEILGTSLRLTPLHPAPTPIVCSSAVSSG